MFCNMFFFFPIVCGSLAYALTTVAFMMTPVVKLVMIRTKSLDSMPHQPLLQLDCRHWWT